ncbi:MAG: FAD-binding oxidoreductase [Bacteroidaceae bacterium]|nr:FAD-binding oxidoreductase [Bacteroidaceae bacterium]
MSRESYASFLAEVRQFLPADRIYTDELRRLGWGTDASFYRLIPQVVLRSDGEAEMARIIRACARHGVPFTFRAAGTSLSGQSLSDSVLIVAGKHWEGYQVLPDGSVRLQPGLVGARVNDILRPLGRVFPPDPASIGSAMVGGIVSNNASGMNCGVHANSDHMLVSARLILADGTILDTGSPESRQSFRTTHPEFLRQIEALRDEVRADAALTARIRLKYSIKNVTGLNLRPLVAYDDPFDIIAHSIVGSEGTLAFLSEVTMKTLRQYPFRASAMVYFHSMEESCRAVVALKALQAGDDDMEMSGENLLVKSAEMLDYLSLNAVDDPVFLQYKADVDAGLVDGVQPGDYHNLTAILTETKATSQCGLSARIARIMSCLSAYRLYRPATFSQDPAVTSKYWAIRSGIFPSVGGTRPAGTSCLIEDVAFPLDVLPEATVRLQHLIADHGYTDACIYGHAFEGNYHFILNQSFQDSAEVERYARMMREVARLVVEDYDGSLKAEHGTGRNMAPFVRYEWGDRAYAVMQRLKSIFDPAGLLNPGVIFNDDPLCFVKSLKPLPVLNFDFSRIPDGGSSLSDTSRSTSLETISQAQRANKCIECGFCEVNCLSCGLTLSSRMRIAVQREMCELQSTGSDPARLAALRSQYRYYGDETCAADGLCATSCPMKINTGELTHLLRQLEMNRHPVSRRAGQFVADHLSSVKSGLRIVLDVASLGHRVLGSALMTRLCRGLNCIGLPLWTTAMPLSRRQPKAGSRPSAQHHDKVVYFPSCINQTMGLPKGAPAVNPLVEETVQLIEKAGYEVVFPARMERLCCGQIWESKGMMDIADRKSAELEKALWEASAHGLYPVLCDQSPCLHRMRRVITGMKLYEPAEFIMTCLVDRLQFHPTDRPIALHLTCSMREMGTDKYLIALASLCSTRVFLPEGVGCCGFAGDKGFTRPELNRYALRKLRPQIMANHIQAGYSNSRTCEIGLQANTGIPYMNIVYLVNACTSSKSNINNS